jgi:hypothetical protein
MEMENYVDVRPLQPPFTGDVAFIELKGAPIDRLALSPGDFRRLAALIGSDRVDGHQILIANSPARFGWVRIMRRLSA